MTISESPITTVILSIARVEQGHTSQLEPLAETMEL